MATPAHPRADDGLPGELRATRIFLRPIANPFALGFVGLAVDTILVSGTELGWIPGAQRHQTALLILAFAPVLQLLASVFGFLARDATAATGMGVLGATWLCIGLSLHSSLPGQTSRGLALLLFVAAVGLLFTALTAAQFKLVPALVLGLAATRFVLSGVHQYGVGTGWAHVSGWVGVALGVVALYAAASLELEDVRHKTVLPTLRHGKGKQVLEPDLADQVQQVAAEAGVRSQL